MIWWRDFIFLLLSTIASHHFVPALTATNVTATITTTTTASTTTTGDATNSTLIASPEAQTALSATRNSSLANAEQVLVAAETLPPIQNNNELDQTDTASLAALTQPQPTPPAQQLQPSNYDEDLVISSSEILNDNGRVSSSKSVSHLTTPTPQTTTTVQLDATNCTKATNEQPHAEQHDAAGDGTNFVTVDTDQTRYSSSRLILRLLLVSLFGLVCLSLTFVYALKFCLCSRRKRHHLALQRNLVADLQLNSAAAAAAHLCQLGTSSPFTTNTATATTTATNTDQQHQQYYQHRQFLNSLECSCGLIERQAHQATGATPLQTSRLRTLLRPSLWGLCRNSLDSSTNSTCRLPRQAIPTLYQQLAVADRIQQLSSAAAAASVVAATGTCYPSIGCPSCLLDLQCRYTGGATTGNHSPPLSTCNLQSQLPTSRPPAYSELFGVSQSSGVISALGQSRDPPGALCAGREESLATTAGDTTTTTTTRCLEVGSCSNAESETTITISSANDDLPASPTSQLLSTNPTLEYPTSQSSQVASDQTNRNLLVKLNLNKTKLLSASDLVLLSRLIDVPIVVQEQNQLDQRQQQPLAGYQAQQTNDEYQVATTSMPTIEPVSIFSDEGRQVDDNGACGATRSPTTSTARGSSLVQIESAAANNK